MDAQNSPSSAKSRRRILSCHTCRRLKSRCEYDTRINSCQRCHKLRLRCSLHSDEPPREVIASGRSDDGQTDNKDRITNLESSLASVKESVDKIWLHLQQDAGRLSQPLDGASLKDPNQIVDRGAKRHREQHLENPGSSFPLQADNEVEKSAPIMVVRKFRPSKRRLYNYPGRDIISQGIINASVAEKLVSEFILRLGHIIQVKSVSDLTQAASIRQTSPLLYAVCCLQALRFYRNSDLVNPNDHRRLYEEVRQMLGQVVLASPIPVEELYALLIMCTFEAAPKPVFEYIESWHLSGICAQQAISSIDFAKIVANLSSGKHEARDKTCLSLWNNICLVNLRFAVGTGKPVTIPSDRLEQCPAIMDHPQATIDDEIVLAEILLNCALCNTDMPLSLDRQNCCPELTVWEKRWEHLLKLEKAINLRLSHEFAYVVLAMRAVEKFRSSGMNESTHQADESTGYETLQIIQDENTPDVAPTSRSFEACAHKHALSMARIFLEMPGALVQELTKFHHICIAYCSIILSECTDKSGNSRVEVFETLRDVRDHYRCFSDEIPAVMTVALENMRRSLEGDALSEGGGQMQGFHPVPSHTRGGPNDASNDQTTGVSESMQDYNWNIPGESIAVEQDINTDLFGGELDLSCLTVDKFFESWMDTGGA
ncbi:hypothetical protein F4779DRAFT_74157 [Xylariaceae sp. FL0662B]|nr:hypothetical protein F4779DRAFT_74157 [Xylariaceae sp. FL0662B]